MKVQVAAVSEDAYDLMREELEADKNMVAITVHKVTE